LCRIAKYGHHHSYEALPNMDMRHRRLSRAKIEVSSAKKLTSPRGRSKFYKGSNKGKDDRDDLKKPELVTSCY